MIRICPRFQSQWITKIFYWAFFHLNFTVTIQYLYDWFKNCKCFTGLIPIFTAQNQFLLDLCDNPKYFMETEILERPQDFQKNLLLQRYTHLIWLNLFVTWESFSWIEHSIIFKCLILCHYNHSERAQTVFQRQMSTEQTGVSGRSLVSLRLFITQTQKLHHGVQSSGRNQSKIEDYSHIFLLYSILLFLFWTLCSQKNLYHTAQWVVLQLKPYNGMIIKSIENNFEQSQKMRIQEHFATRAQTWMTHFLLLLWWFILYQNPRLAQLVRW